MAAQRTTSGIPGLDEILEGGLIPQRTYLLAGAAGSGNTVFSFQWLYDGLRNCSKLHLLSDELSKAIKRLCLGPVLDKSLADRVLGYHWRS
jgi:KaiC/GvpD/RAD55 family RecA-like ATPase